MSQDRQDHRISIEPNSMLRGFLARKLQEHNAEILLQTNAAGHESLNIALLDSENRIVGGLSGYTYWLFCQIECLWVAEEIRGNGYGSMLLQECENQAAENTCRFILLDTFSFQSPRFYLGRGFEQFGVINGLSRAHSRYYLKKEIKQVPSAK